MSDTIAAVATAPGEGGIAVVRLSGPAAPALLEQFFSPRSPKEQGFPLPPRKMVLGHFLDGEKKPLDQILAVFFPSPGSYTGEDVAEFHSHGGHTVAQLILEQLCSSEHVRLADPGEFTRRAFLSGKIDLPQAEATLGIISSRSAAGAHAASRGVDGETEKLLSPLLENLLRLLGEIQVILDFPDEEYDENTQEELSAELEQLTEALLSLRTRFFSGVLLDQGIHVVLAGRPNAGKSSLFNALLGRERALVTSVPGTTRDVVTDSFTHQGITCFLHDVAGLRESEDMVEKLGIHLAQEKISASNVVLVLFDGSEDLHHEAASLWETLSPLKTSCRIPIVSKSDIRSFAEEDLPPLLKESTFWSTPPLLVSSLQKKGLEKIKSAVLDCVLQEKTLASSVYATTRQLDEMDQCIHHLQDASRSIQNTQELDATSSDLSLALSSLQRILGKEWDDLLLDRIFSAFCLGK